MEGKGQIARVAHGGACLTRSARGDAWKRVVARGAAARRHTARESHAPPSRVFSGPIFVLTDSIFQNKIIYALKNDINDHKNKYFGSPHLL